MKDLCLTCHDDKAKLIETAKVQHPGAAGDCTDCHSPHASTLARTSQNQSVDICLGCHSDQAEQGKKAHLHQPAFVQGCATCHEPHGGDNDHLLRAQGNALCLECHGPDSKPSGLRAAHLVTIFNGKVKLPENYFSQVIRAAAAVRPRSPVQSHPISDVFDPKT